MSTWLRPSLRAIQDDLKEDATAPTAAAAALAAELGVGESLTAPNTRERSRFDRF